MTHKNKALKLALEALENHEGNYKLSDAGCDRHELAITAINQALAAAADVPLTDDQISAIGSKIFPSTWNTRHVEFARAIEAAHGITAAPKKGQP
jgi:pyruvate/2-oxoacid:ferredoxin oxidoreductase beta subunit